MPWLRPLIAGFLLWTVFRSHASPCGIFFLSYSDPLLPTRFRCRGLLLRLITLSDTHTHARTHTHHTLTRTHTYAPTHTHTAHACAPHMHAHNTHARAHTHTPHARTHAQARAYIHARTQTQARAHAHTRTHSKKHTHTHTFGRGMGPSLRPLPVRKRHSQQTDRQTSLRRKSNPQSLQEYGRRPMPWTLRAQ